MSVFTFSPGPPHESRDHTFLTWEDGFSDDEIEKIIEHGNSRMPSMASVGGNWEDPTKVRHSDISWIGCEDETQWLYERLAFVARSLNSKFYNFDLHGFVEDFQYTVYHGDVGGHYGWHIDKGVGTIPSPRKMSMVLQLSDPSEYEGGELQLWGSHKPVTVERRKGLLAAFPSYLLHQVTPVTAGTRRSLVVWVAGPPFK
jgi:PKHD-type hydroxylase